MRPEPRRTDGIVYKRPIHVQLHLAFVSMLWQAFPALDVTGVAIYTIYTVSIAVVAK
jgi:hypothetical protein